NRFDPSSATIEVFPNSPAILNITLKDKKGGDETKKATNAVSAGELDPAIPEKARKEFEKASDAGRDGKTDLAIAHLRKAIEIYPKYLMAHNDLGTQLLAKGELADAADEFLSAISIDPKAFNPQLNLGIVRYQQQRFGEAADILRKALALQPNSPS